MIVTVDIDTAITIKTMLAFAVADCPEKLHDEFADARAEFLSELSKCEERLANGPS